MEYFTLQNQEIQSAISDLTTMIRGVNQNISNVMLFGSTLSIPAKDAKDIDFFIDYKNISFEILKEELLKTKLRRRVVVEDIMQMYSNCPKWPKESPLAIHIILYKKGVSKLSEKLIKTRKKAIDISNIVLSNLV